jgi:recombinational DNA repair protein (RecF pathway)
MYEKYTTDALVLTQHEYGEHDRTFALFTQDFGLVYARASAVRKMESKMRSALPLFAPASVSLVRGTRGWRVTGARARAHESLSPEGAHTFARITQLLTRLVRGEERNQYLFEVLCGARIACATPRGLSIAAAELLCVARMLYALGYLSPQALTTALFTHAQYEEKDLGIVEEAKSGILTSVNSALAETQL